MDPLPSLTTFIPRKPRPRDCDSADQKCTNCLRCEGIARSAQSIQSITMWGDTSGGWVRGTYSPRTRATPSRRRSKAHEQLHLSPSLHEINVDQNTTSSYPPPTASYHCPPAKDAFSFSCSAALVPFTLLGLPATGFKGSEEPSTQKRRQKLEIEAKKARNRVPAQRKKPTRGSASIFCALIFNVHLITVKLRV